MSVKVSVCGNVHVYVCGVWKYVCVQICPNFVRICLFVCKCMSFLPLEIRPVSLLHLASIGFPIKYTAKLIVIRIAIRIVDQSIYLLSLKNICTRWINFITVIREEFHIHLLTHCKHRCARHLQGASVDWSATVVNHLKFIRRRTAYRDLCGGHLWRPN